MISIRWIFKSNFKLQKKMKSYAEYYEAVFTDCGKIQLWLKIKICKLLKLVTVTMRSEVMKCYFDPPKSLPVIFNCIMHVQILIILRALKL